MLDIGNAYNYNDFSLIAYFLVLLRGAIPSFFSTIILRFSFFRPSPVSLSLSSFLLRRLFHLISSCTFF